MRSVRVSVRSRIFMSVCGISMTLVCWHKLTEFSFIWESILKEILGVHHYEAISLLKMINYAPAPSIYAIDYITLSSMKCVDTENFV